MAENLNESIENENAKNEMQPFEADEQNMTIEPQSMQIAPMAAAINLPADLPENWTANQIVSHDGVSAGLTEKHGYNYLMKQVNDTQKAANQLGAAVNQLDIIATQTIIYPAILPSGINNFRASYLVKQGRIVFVQLNLIRAGSIPFLNSQNIFTFPSGITVFDAPQFIAHAAGAGVDTAIPCYIEDNSIIIATSRTDIIYISINCTLLIH